MLLGFFILAPLRGSIFMPHVGQFLVAWLNFGRGMTEALWFPRLTYKAIVTAAVAIVGQEEVKEDGTRKAILAAQKRTVWETGSHG
jgi:hypothetical protein